MHADLHDAMRQLIDKSLAGEASLQELSPQEQHALGEHLHACAQCESYASDGRRAIAALSGFSFTADSGSQEKIHAALALRTQQLQAAQPNLARTVRPNRARIIQITVAALLLTLAGSFGAAHLGDLVAAVLHLPAAQAHTGLLTFWIAPSWCFALLLPVMLLVSARSANRKGQTL